MPRCKYNCPKWIKRKYFNSISWRENHDRWVGFLHTVKWKDHTGEKHQWWINGLVKNCSLLKNLIINVLVLLQKISTTLQTLFKFSITPAEYKYIAWVLHSSSWPIPPRQSYTSSFLCWSYCLALLAPSCDKPRQNDHSSSTLQLTGLVCSHLGTLYSTALAPNWLEMCQQRCPVQRQGWNCLPGKQTQLETTWGWSYWGGSKTAGAWSSQGDNLRQASQ